MTEVDEFKEVKVKNGWKLNIFKNNPSVITTSLYDSGGDFKDLKSFIIKEDSDVDLLKKYVELFEEDPEKNFQELIKIEAKRIGK